MQLCYTVVLFNLLCSEIVVTKSGMVLAGLLTYNGHLSKSLVTNKGPFDGHDKMIGYDKHMIS
jgi:hypothetical protein